MGTIGLRCPVCLTNWPYSSKEYSKCPECRETTRALFTEEGPLSAREAKLKVNNIAFEQYYWKTRGVPP